MNKLTKVMLKVKWMKMLWTLPVKQVFLKRNNIQLTFYNKLQFLILQKTNKIKQVIIKTHLQEIKFRFNNRRQALRACLIVRWRLSNLRPLCTEQTTHLWVDHHFVIQKDIKELRIWDMLIHHKKNTKEKHIITDRVILVQLKIITKSRLLVLSDHLLVKQDNLNS